MTASVSMGQFRAGAFGGRALEPEVLLEQGILGNPNDPNDACRRARGLVAQGEYKEARALLLPHVNAEGPVNRAVLELLAQTAMLGGGADWRVLLAKSLAAHELANDLAGVARNHRYLGEMLLAKGELKSADGHLRVAASGFAKQGQVAEAALTECARARVRLRAGFVERAFKRVEHAIAELTTMGQPRALALAQLDRARILAQRGEASLAAKDLLLAERVLGVSGNRGDRIKVRVVRAETLLIAGEPLRAASGLQRSLVDVVDLEDSATCAQVHLLLGEALLERDPSGARRHLMRSRHLYEAIGFEYPVAACDIALARVEGRLGLNPRARLANLSQSAFAEWPELSMRLQLLHAELAANDNPEQARTSLYKVRSFGQEAGNHALVRAADIVLRGHGLVSQEEAEDLTPVEVREQTASVTRLRPTPQPMLIHTDESPAPQLAQPSRSNAERLVQPITQNKTSPSLMAPRPTLVVRTKRS